MKFLLVLALLCLALEGYLWRPEAEPASNQSILSTIPAGATYRLPDGRTGKTPADIGAAGLREIHLEKFGYQSETVSKPTQPVELRLSPLGWVVFHAPLALMLLCLAGAYRLRSREPGEVRRVGPYRLFELVGRGATAEVYRAQDGQGRTVALKWLHEQSGGTQEFAARFRREAEICSRLHHPGIVRVFAWGEHEGRLWMSQEWIDGATLEQNPVGASAVQDLLLNLCEALQYAHASGVTHRDLKPSNILLRSNGKPVIADFGLARSAHYDTITKTETTLGTPTYMPPEQILGQGSDGRSDIYSLGCLIFWLWQKRLPFLGADAIKTLLAHLHDPVPELPSEPGGWAELVQQLLAKDREQRPASAQEVLTRLQSLAPLG